MQIIPMVFDLFFCGASLAESQWPPNQHTTTDGRGSNTKTRQFLQSSDTLEKLKGQTKHFKRKKKF